MKAGLGCIPCTVRTALDVAEKAATEKNQQSKIMEETLQLLSTIDYSDMTPAKLHTLVSRIVKKNTGIQDPFKALKEECNKKALQLVPILEERIGELKGDWGLRLALRTSVCGNALDFEVEGYDFDVKKFKSSILRCLDQHPLIDDTDKLLSLFKKSEKVLYMLDNAGEIVFDKLLIQKIIDIFNCDVVAVVKQDPILNDATLKDTEDVGMTSTCKVITTGEDHLGVDLEKSSNELKKNLRLSDLIIAKGQGNYESMTEHHTSIKKPICYLLRVKCKVISNYLQIPVNNNVILVWSPIVK